MIKRVFRTIRFYLSESFQSSWKVALVPVLLLSYGLGVYVMLHFRIGLGMWEYLVIPLAVAIFLGLAIALVDGIETVMRSLPMKFVAVVTGSFLFISIMILIFMPMVLPVAAFALSVVAVQVLLGASVGALLFSRRSKVFPIIVLLITVSINVWGVRWLMSPGSDALGVTVPTTSTAAASILNNLTRTNPTEPGPWPVLATYYGSGTDQRREEYGAKVELTTPTVDATVMLSGTPTWKRKLRAWYWGFDLGELPLNARVWMPEGEGSPFPLVLIVHGNHQMEEYSDPGYEYLGEHLASRGYMVASIDENFLNGSWSGDLSNENQVRAWLLLQHLKQWEMWNETKGNRFFAKVDLDRIALVGHSRGGEAVALATAFNELNHNPDHTGLPWDFGFAIQTVIAIAPSDGQFLPANKPVTLKNVNYLALQGSYDADVYSFMGSSQWQRISFTDHKSYYKASVYIEGANHGQFNTVWGRADIPKPLNHFLQTAPILQATTQQEVAKAYITAFLDLTLHDQKQYSDLFQHAQAIQGIIPNVKVITEYRDSSCSPLVNFEEDIDVTTTTVTGGQIAALRLSKWQEHTYKPGLRVPTETSVVSLGWRNRQGLYIVSLSESPFSGERIRLDNAFIYLSVADSSQDQSHPLNFSLEVSDGSVTSRLSVADYAPVGMRFTRQLTKGSLIDKLKYNSPYEKVTQTVLVPLKDFLEITPSLEISEVKQIRLRFDLIPEGEIILSELGIGGF